MDALAQPGEKVHASAPEKESNLQFDIRASAHVESPGFLCVEECEGLRLATINRRVSWLEEQHLTSKRDWINGLQHVTDIAEQLDRIRQDILEEKHCRQAEQMVREAAEGEFRASLDQLSTCVAESLPPLAVLVETSELENAHTEFAGCRHAEVVNRSLEAMRRTLCDARRIQTEVRREVGRAVLESRAFLDGEWRLRHTKHTVLPAVAEAASKEITVRRLEALEAKLAQLFEAPELDLRRMRNPTEKLRDEFPAHEKVSDVEQIQSLRGSLPTSESNSIYCSPRDEVRKPRGLVGSSSSCEELSPVDNDTVVESSCGASPEDSGNRIFKKMPKEGQDGEEPTSSCCEEFVDTPIYQPQRRSCVSSCASMRTLVAKSSQPELANVGPLALDTRAPVPQARRTTPRLASTGGVKSPLSHEASQVPPLQTSPCQSPCLRVTHRVQSSPRVVTRSQGVSAGSAVGSPSLGSRRVPFPQRPSSVTQRTAVEPTSRNSSASASRRSTLH